MGMDCWLSWLMKNCFVESQNGHDGIDLHDQWTQPPHRSSPLLVDQETKIQREQLICLESHSKYAQVTQTSEFIPCCLNWRSSLLVLGKLAEGACCPGFVLILGPILNDLMDYGIPLEVGALVYSWRTGDTSQREKSTGSFHPTSNPAAGGY